MTPASTVAAADKINRSKATRCLNCTADYSDHSETGRWLVSPLPLVDPSKCYYTNHAGLEELAKTIEELKI